MAERLAPGSPCVAPCRHPPATPGAPSSPFFSFYTPSSRLPPSLCSCSPDELSVQAPGGRHDCGGLGRGAGRPGAGRAGMWVRRCLPPRMLPPPAVPPTCVPERQLRRLPACLPGAPPAPRPARQIYGCPIGGTISREPWTTDGSGSTFLWGYLDSEFRWVLVGASSCMPAHLSYSCCREGVAMRQAVASAAGAHCPTSPHPQAAARRHASCLPLGPGCSEGMSREEAETVVATALALAMSRDGSSGGVIR